MTIILLILVAVIAVILLIRQIYGAVINNVERPSTLPVKKIDGISIVTMPAEIRATIRTKWWIAWSASNAFGSLAGYIFGDNKTSWKIVMTAPVTTKQAEQWVYETAFIMPSKWTMETLPVPNNNNVTLKEMPASKRAIWTFKGYATESNVQKQRTQFKQLLEKNNIKRTWTMTLAQYNAPTTPPWMRRNELWVELSE